MSAPTDPGEADAPKPGGPEPGGPEPGGQEPAVQDLGNQESGGLEQPEGDLAPSATRKRSVYWRPPGSTTGAGRFVTVALAGTIGVLWVLIATSVSILVNRERWVPVDGSDPAPFALGWLAGIGFALVGIGTLTAIAWMVWQHRAHANRTAMVDGALKPAVVWWWLVPVASVFMPFVAIRDLARGEHDRPGLRRWWWATYLLFGFASGLATILPFYVAEGAWQEWLSILSYLVGIVAAVLAIRVVRLIDAGLEVGRQQEGWPTGWQPVSGRAQLLFILGGAAAASVGALAMGAIFPQLLEQVARTEAGAVVTNDLSVGTCFDHRDADYESISCEAPHGAEAYANLTYPSQAAYPGPEALESWAEPLCYSRFEKYTGIRYEESSLDFGYLYPGNQGWASGDHEVICYLFDPAGKDLTQPIATGSGTA